MPRRKQNTTPPTLMLHILERIHNIRDTPQAAQAAKTSCPRMRRIPRLKRHISHSPLPTRRTIRRRRSARKIRNRRRVLVYGAALLLGRHAGRVLGLQVCALRLLGRRRAMGELLGGRAAVGLLWVGGELGLLLLVLLDCVGVLLVGGRLVGHVGVCGVLLHWYTLFLHLVCIDRTNPLSK